jgi:TldD protein
VTGGGGFAMRFGLDEELVRRILSRGLERGGDFCELFAQRRVSTDVGFEDGQVNRASTSVDLGVGVRVLKGDQTGYAFTEELAERSLLAAADTAASIASGPRSASLGAVTAVALPRLYAPAPLWAEVSPSRKIRFAERVGNAIAAADPAVVKAGVAFGDEDEEIFVANSEGLRAEDSRPMAYMYASCTARRGDRVESNSHSRAARLGPEMFGDAFLDELAAEAVHRTLALFDARVPPAGEMPVVLAPATSGILLHEAMGHGFEADFNRKGTSLFCTMMGKRIGEKFVTIVDTALEPGARGAIAVDDEGTPGQSTVLVEDGVLVSYLHDRLSAAHYGVARTGNGRRESFRCAPLPRMRVTTMENGPHDPEEIVRSVKRGLYAVDFSNGEVDIGGGDYSFYVKSGFLIEDGRLTAPVKDVNLIGNGPDSLAKIEMVGNDKAIDPGTWTCGKDGQSVPVGLGLPTIKVRAITIGGVNE